MSESKDRKGIYVRVGYPRSEVLWLDGHRVIDKAYQEAALAGDSISEVLLADDQGINLSNLMYDEYGVFLGRKVLREITVKEAVRYLGRHLQICRFLTTQEEATRFAKLLEEGDDDSELRIAQEVRLMIPLLPKLVPGSEPKHKAVPMPKMSFNAPVGVGR
jgi:hypothetical protein